MSYRGSAYPTAKCLDTAIPAPSWDIQVRSQAYGVGGGQAFSKLNEDSPTSAVSTNRFFSTTLTGFCFLCPILSLVTPKSPSLPTNLSLEFQAHFQGNYIPFYLKEQHLPQLPVDLCFYNRAMVHQVQSQQTWMHGGVPPQADQTMSLAADTSSSFLDIS